MNSPNRNISFVKGEFFVKLPDSHVVAVVLNTHTIKYKSTKEISVDIYNMVQLHHHHKDDLSIAHKN